MRQTDRKDYAAPALSLVDVIYTQFLHLPIPGRDDATAADLRQAWADIVARLEKGPAYIEAGQKLVTHPGKLYGVAGRKQIAGAPDFLNGALTAAAKEQLAADPAALARFDAARDAVLATLAQDRRLHRGPRRRVARQLRDGQGGLRPDAAARAAAAVHGADVEGMARDELAHGWAEEAWVKSLAAQRKVAFGAESGGGMAPDGPALIDYYRDRIAQLRTFVADHDLVTIPAWLGSMDVVETPKFQQPVSPGASMESPRLFAKSANGHYFITPPKSLKDAAERLDMNEDFDRDRILSTAAHEAMPGHFLQLSIARRHSDYIRKIQYLGRVRRGLGVLRRGDVRAPGPVRRRPRRAPVHRALGTRARRPRDRRRQAGQRRVDAGAGRQVLRGAVGLHQVGRPRPRSPATRCARATCIAYTVGRLQLEELLAEYQRPHGRQGLAARLPRPPAVVRLDAVRHRRARAAGRPRQAGQRGARRRQLLRRRAALEAQGATVAPAPTRAALRRRRVVRK